MSIFKALFGTHSVESQALEGERGMAVVDRVLAGEYFIGGSV